jgi:hypothetical protein
MRPMRRKGESEMRKITIDLLCGETTCSGSPGVYCQFLLQRIDDEAACYCSLFGERIRRDENQDIKGQLLRCPDCIQAEKGPDQDKLNRGPYPPGTRYGLIKRSNQ